MHASPLLSLLRRVEVQGAWRMSYNILPQQQQQQQQQQSVQQHQFSTAASLDQDRDLDAEWYDNDLCTAHDALKLLVSRIQAQGPVKQHHLQRLYQRCTTGEELDRALKLTRLNWLARGELRQHRPFSHRTSEVFIGRALSLGVPEIAQRALKEGSVFGLSADSHKEAHPLLIYYSKAGDLERMFALYDALKAAGRVPGPDTCYILVKGCVDCGRPDLAELTIAEFRVAGIRIRQGTLLYLEQNRGKASAAAAATSAVAAAAAAAARGEGIDAAQAAAAQAAAQVSAQSAAAPQAATAPSSEPPSPSTP